MKSSRTSAPIKKGRGVQKAAVDRIAMMMDLGRGRSAAAAAYQEAFGRSPEDPAIEDELEIIFRKSDKQKTNVAVPLPLLLGILLRPRGKGKGRRGENTRRMTKRYNKMAIDWASIRWAELVEQYERQTGKRARQSSSKLLKHLAAEWAHQKIGLHNLSFPRVERYMRLDRGRVLLAKGRAVGHLGLPIPLPT